MGATPPCASAYVHYAGGWYASPVRTLRRPRGDNQRTCELSGGPKGFQITVSLQPPPARTVISRAGVPRVPASVSVTSPDTPRYTASVAASTRIVEAGALLFGGRARARVRVSVRL